MYTTVISAQQLQALLTSGQPSMVFDCSFELMQPAAGDQQYQQEHLPSAVRADLDRHLSASKSGPSASGGRHPLPTLENFAAWLSRIGFTNNMQAVVYDRQGANYCGRLWWMLKWAGHETVAVLDGGLQAWQACGGVTEQGLPAELTATSSFTPCPNHARLVPTDTVIQQLGRPTQTLVDARGTPRFKGDIEPIDPVAGHIPGALNRPLTQNFGTDGTFKPAAELKAEFEFLLAGRDPTTVVHHCGSGVSAVPNMIAMEIAGLGPTALYASSWSEWCSDARRPMARS
jgi:thiosulfate/3-mercaptopyruvate sulfurtransferase